MGWLWSDTKPVQPAQPSGNRDTHSKDNEALTPAPRPQEAPAPAPPRELTRDEQADAELQAFLEELNYAPSDYPPSSTPSPSTSSESSPSAAATSYLKTSTASPQPSASPLATSAISPVRLLPTSMSCRAAFDQAYHCQLPGGQFTHLYRYGGLRNCSELWSNFWFCMRTNRGYMDEAERARRIRQHYWGREAKYRTGPSSEDVWRVRTDVEHEPFTGDFEEVREILREQNRKAGEKDEGTR